MIKKILVILLLIVSSSVLADEPMVVFVSPTGLDINPGTKSKPVKSLEVARNLLRKQRKQGQKAVVMLAPGTYRRTKTFEMDARDSNTIYMKSSVGGADKSQTVRITGGYDINVGKLPHVKDAEVLSRVPEAVRGQVLVIDLKSLAPDWSGSGEWPLRFQGYAGWPEVSSSGLPLQIARWPNAGYASIKSILDAGSKPRFEEKPSRNGRFVFNEKEPTQWKIGAELYLGGMWCYNWSDEYLRVSSIDPIKHEIQLATPHYYGLGGPSGGLYYAINIPEILDLPGEFVYDRKLEKIYILPPDNAQLLSVSLPEVPLVKIAKADNIIFYGITFEQGRGSGVEISKSMNVRLEKCVVRLFARSGVIISGGTRCGVRKSELSQIGGTCISLNGGDRNALTSSKHFAEGNNIHHYARLYQTYNPAVKLSGVGQVVSHNYIHDAPHNGILFDGNLHLMEYNRIERVCLDATDSGAIYCGRDWTIRGTIIRHNWFSDIGKSTHFHNWCVYLDDQASGVIIKRNLIANTDSGILVGGGRDNIVKENIFANCPLDTVRIDARGIGNPRDHEPTLRGRLKAVPYKEEPWKSRFPNLYRIDDERPAWPVGNVITKNILVASKPINSRKECQENGRIIGNIEFNDKGELSLKNGQAVWTGDSNVIPKWVKKVQFGQ